MTNATGSLIALIIGIIGVAVLVKVLRDSNKDKKYVCPTCGNVLRIGIPKCPSCRTTLRWPTTFS